ncbi:Nn.00g001650.m01.CDS01 [Neocucurbitaria sp. VM-36]
MPMIRAREKPSSLDIRSCSKDDFKCIIDIATPCSVTPFAPKITGFDIEHAFEDEDAWASEISKVFEPPSRSTLMKQMVNSLLTAQQATTSTQSILASEYSILTYLHTNTVTLADVEALIPAMNSNFNIMDKLALNIGWYHSRGYLPNTEIEQMLIHILMNGDTQNIMFEQTKAQIERFQSWSYQRVTRAKAQEEAAKASREAQHRRRSMPAKYKKLSLQGVLPYGCACLADMYADVYGMMWSEILELNNTPRATSRSKLKTELIRADALASSNRILGLGSFSQTRLHNGPGLTDRRKPKVCLPRADARVVVTSAKALDVVKPSETDGDLCGSRQRERGSVRS